MKILTVLGARPQFIKAAAFSRAVDNIDNIKEVANKLKDMIDQECFLGDEDSENIKKFIKEASSWSSNIKNGI